jgi:hypothetical protein
MPFTYLLPGKCVPVYILEENMLFHLDYYAPISLTFEKGKNIMENKHQELFRSPLMPLWLLVFD